MKLRLVVGIVGCVAALGMPVASAARSGSIDRSFGEGGRVSLPSFSRGPIRTTQGLDGSLVVLGDGRVVKLLVSGERDPGFGDDGKIVLPSEVDGMKFEPSAVVVDGQARILIFGSAVGPEAIDRLPMASTPTTWAVAMRLDLAGGLDPSFGAGKGYIRDDFGLRSGLSSSLPTVSVLSASVDSQGRPLMVLGLAEEESPCYGHSGAWPAPRAVVRLEPSGATDTTFGGGGTLRIGGRSGYVGHFSTVNGLEPLVATGSQACPWKLVVYRFDAFGFPKADFGQDGVRIFAAGVGVVQQTGELILRRGWPTSSLIKIGATGEMDRSFGNSGVAEVRMPAGTQRTLRPVGVQPDGRIVLVGGLSRGRSGAGDVLAPRRRFLVVGRTLPSGRIDRSFGREGWILTPVGHGAEVNVPDAYLEQRGRLMAVVRTYGAHERQARPFLIRYLLDD